MTDVVDITIGPAAEIESEQNYLDAAREHRERMRNLTAHAPASAVHPGAAVLLRSEAEAELRRMAPPGEAVAFGRIDQDDGDAYYIGKDAVFDDESEVLVVNWQAAVAAPYYEASHSDPMGLTRKRQFDVDGHRILDFEDLLFAELQDEVGRLHAFAEPNDTLLSDLARSRTGELQDIVQTIQSAQYELLRQPLDQLLVVQGGPGTGKTVVGLHRVSWLLYNHADRLAPGDVLVVGPSRVFTRYIQKVLPSLGDEDVMQVDIRSLSPTVTRGRTESDDSARLKGETRMIELLRRALHARVGFVGAEPITLRFGSLTVRLERAWIEERVTELAALPYAEGRQAFRERVIGEAMRGTRLDERTVRQGQIDPMVERVWPQLTPPSFLQALYASRDRLLTAAGDDFTAREVALLQRKATERISDETWSDADLALLDEADELINGGRRIRRYSHIVVDEAQDLSPMQLRSIRRRSSTGSMTILGDIAQSTGPWSRDSWDEVIFHLGSDLPAQIANLRFGYRVPRQIFEVAAQLLPHAAPGIEPPVIVRDAEDPGFIQSEDAELLAEAALAAVSQQARLGRSVGMIVPEVHLERAKDALRSHRMTFADAADGRLSAAINVVTPADAKGLEFDAVVVVDPAAIVAETDRGHRMLYVALTRATTSLTVVYSDEPPIPTGERSAQLSFERLPAPVDQPRPEWDAEVAPLPLGRPTANPLVAAVARSLAASVRETVNPELWTDVVAELTAQLEIGPTER